MNAPDFNQALETLKENFNAMPWTERRELAQTCIESIKQSPQSAPTHMLHLIDLLLDDPRMEVRKSIADMVHLLPEHHFHKATAKLGVDHNAFVRSAAERALERKKRTESVTSKRRKTSKSEGDLSNLEALLGSKGAAVVHQHAQNLFEVMVGTSVHEIRTFITSMKGNVELLLKECDNGHGVNGAQRLGPKLRQSFQFVERLMDDMKAFTQVTPGKRRSERIADVVGEALALVVDHFNACNFDVTMIKLLVNVPNSLSAPMSRMSMVLALRNLIKNAFEAHMTKPGTFVEGHVEVRAEIRDEQLSISISDGGSGLGADELNQLRQMVPGRTSKRYYGTGYGLPMAHRNINSHGGIMKIESEEAAGTNITITLPLDHSEP
jgi:signal transduction histidine kinase